MEKVKLCVDCINCKPDDNVRFVCLHPENTITSVITGKRREAVNIAKFRNEVCLGEMYVKDIPNRFFEWISNLL